MRTSRCSDRSTTSSSWQSAVIADVNDFKLLMMLALAAMPLVLLLRKAGGPPPDAEHAVVAE
jgi:DHA2 family multidrug resistance protein